MTNAWSLLYDEMTDPNRFKYSEDHILKELTDYISATYNQHYSCLLYTSPSPRDS